MKPPNLRRHPLFPPRCSWLRRIMRSSSARTLAAVRTWSIHMVTLFLPVIWLLFISIFLQHKCRSQCHKASLMLLHRLRSPTLVCALHQFVLDYWPWHQDPWLLMCTRTLCPQLFSIHNMVCLSYMKHHYSRLFFCRSASWYTSSPGDTTTSADKFAVIRIRCIIFLLQKRHWVMICVETGSPPTGKPSPFKRYGMSRTNLKPSRSAPFGIDAHYGNILALSCLSSKHTFYCNCSLALVTSINKHCVYCLFQIKSKRRTGPQCLCCGRTPLRNKRKLMAVAKSDPEFTCVLVCSWHFSSCNILIFSSFCVCTLQDIWVTVFLSRESSRSSKSIIKLNQALKVNKCSKIHVLTWSCMQSLFQLQSVALALVQKHNHKLVSYVSHYLIYFQLLWVNFSHSFAAWFLSVSCSCFEDGWTRDSTCQTVWFRPARWCQERGNRRWGWRFVFLCSVLFTCFFFFFVVELSEQIQWYRFSLLTFNPALIFFCSRTWSWSWHGWRRSLG